MTLVAWHEWQFKYKTKGEEEKKNEKKNEGYGNYMVLGYALTLTSQHKLYPAIPHVQTSTKIHLLTYNTIQGFCSLIL